MKTIVAQPADFARTFTLIARPDTHYFVSHDLPEFLESLIPTGSVRLRNYFERLRSGEYIPKASYSDSETNYVYLTIGQFSGPYVSFEELTFLEESVGEAYAHLQVKHGDLVITRSGTVGVVHIFRAPDDKIYIPSHHLAIIETPHDAEHSAEYLRLFLQSEFPRRYFWAFASGKGQKEISNWSIKSIPIPQVADPHEIARRCQDVEQEILSLREQIATKQREKEQVLYEAVRHLS